MAAPNVDARIQQGLARGLTTDQMMDKNSPDYVLDGVPSAAPPPSSFRAPWETTDASRAPWEDPSYNQAIDAANPIGPAQAEAARRVISAFGYGAARVGTAASEGAAEGWGSAPIENPDGSVFSKETDEILKKFGIMGNANALTSLFDNAIRASVTAASVAQRGLGGAIGGLIGGAGQVGAEFGGSKKDFEAFAQGALSDPEVQLVTMGFGEVGALSNAKNFEARVFAARAKGLLAEGNAGAFDAVPLTPENTEARAAAAKEAGIPVQPPPQLPADIHDLARRVDPVTMQKFDALAAEKEQQQQTIRALTDHGVEEKDPALIKARAKLEAADKAMDDLLPDLNDAYHTAREMAPEMAAKLDAPAETATEGAAQAAPKPSEMDKEVEGAEKKAAPEGGSLKPVEGTGETKTPALAQGVEAKAIEAKLTEGFGDLPERKQISMADQAEKVVALMDKDYEGAKAIAMGDKAPPKGVLLASVFVGVENRALAAGDAATLKALATSKTTDTMSTMGANIRTLRERNPNSPVGAIQDLQKSREVAAAVRNKNIDAIEKETLGNIKAETRAAATKAPAWEKFINDLTCKE
jgi:hypothetical protein